MNASLSRGQLDRFRGIVSERIGLQFDDGKLDYLAGIVRERMGAVGCADFSSYEAHLTERDEMRRLADLLTVGETYFFRYRDHFRALGDVALPARTEAQRGRRRIRVLSAGCASGEEAYSIAMLVRERACMSSPWAVDISGIDLSPAMIGKAMRARYTTWSLRETSTALRERYFQGEGREFRLAEEVTSMVSFEERNLCVDDPLFWHANAFDIVFCRNVMMYFAPDVMSAVVARIARSLSPGGFLFLGHAETLRGVSSAFHLRHTHETFYYQLRGVDDAPTLAPMTISPSTFAERATCAPSVAAGLASESTTWVELIQRASDRVAQLTTPLDGPGIGAERSASEVPRPPVRVDLRAAVELLRQERFAEAMDLVHSFPSTSRSDPDAQLLHAALLTNSGNLAEAEGVCARILAEDELSAGAHYLAALCREHVGDLGGALEHDQSAAYLDPSFAMPHLHLGLLARRRGDHEQARAELGRALALLPREDASRILLFGGGFSREALVSLCRAELRASEGRA